MLKETVEEIKSPINVLSMNCTKEFTDEINKLRNTVFYKERSKRILETFGYFVKGKSDKEKI
jgi:hypothetical protein